MQQEPANPTYLYVGAFVDELQRAGVRNVVICPGSRSTPLALAFAAQSHIHTWMHVDERSAAYFGLGMARQTRRVVALLCTSGTAAANFLPALVEARLSHLPLLVLTADRPHELRENGAPQSIDQNRLYGTHVKWFVEVALPAASDVALRYIRTTAARATAFALARPAGPVHLNMPLREPLTPVPAPGQWMPALTQRDPAAWQGRPAGRPYIEVHQAALATPTDEDLQSTLELLHTARRGLIVAGPNDDPELVEPLVRMAGRLGYPVLADPLSQLRCGEHDRSPLICGYDAFLRSDFFCAGASPELILRFGAMPTSKSLLLYLQRHAACPQVIIDGNEDWQEPTQLAGQLLHTDPAALCRKLLDRQCGARQQGCLSLAWLHTWQAADRVTRHTLHSVMQGFTELFEGRVFYELSNLLPDGTLLFAGNSMPVRDLDTFYWSSSRRIHFMGNRGANGIDGIVSSALGASAGGGEPALLVLGDLSFYHDLNGLLAARLHRLNLTIVLINNDGGGIFSFLPQAAYPEHFERLFGTPTGLNVRLAVEMYGGQFHSVASWESFRRAVSLGLHSSGLTVVEVVTDRTRNVEMHRQLWLSVEKALQASAGDRGEYA